MKIGDMVSINWNNKISRTGIIVAKRLGDKIPEIDGEKNAKKMLEGINEGLIYVDTWVVLVEGELFNYSERILEVLRQ